jgi:hypothetical protein
MTDSLNTLSWGSDGKYTVWELPLLFLTQADMAPGSQPLLMLDALEEPSGSE